MTEGPTRVRELIRWGARFDRHPDGSLMLTREGGHHANAEGEAQGIYDDGYVVVTKVAKQSFLDSSKALAMLGRDPKADALEAEWKKVEAAWAKHIASVR